MREIKKTCNLGYYHLPHRAKVRLLNDDGTVSDERWLACGGSAPRYAEPSTPGWLHDCSGVGHEVWTVAGATCVFCGAFNRKKART